jgi:hypothetical protein
MKPFFIPLFIGLFHESKMIAKGLIICFEDCWAMYAMIVGSQGNALGLFRLWNVVFQIYDHLPTMAKEFHAMIFEQLFAGCM